jgi:hypothetical protein
VRTILTFRSTAFNTTKPQPYFINACCFGDDVARWLIARLRDRAVEAQSEPGQEDFGWYLGLRFAGARYFVLVSFRPDDVIEGKTWILFVERNRGLIGSMFRGRRRGIDPALPELLYAILTDAREIEDPRLWDADEFDSASEGLYGLKP